MTKKFWSIPVITVYMYAVTVISNIGFTGYFDIPMYYAGASIKSNIVFAKMIFDGIWAISVTLGILWLLLLPAVLIVAFYTQRLWSYIGMIALFIFLFFGASSLGRFIAERQPTFVVPSEACEQFKGTNYVGITANEGSFVFIKVDENKKMLPGFYPIEESSLSCGLVYKDAGPVVK